MSDNELDNLFKEAADGFKVPNDPSAWQAMSSKLDQAAIATSFWNWKTISSLTLVGVTGIALILYLSLTTNADKIAASHLTLNQVIENKPEANKPAIHDNETSLASSNLQKNNDLIAEENDQNRSEVSASESRVNSERSIKTKSRIAKTDNVRSQNLGETQISTSEQRISTSKQQDQNQSSLTSNTKISNNRIENYNNNKGVQPALIAEVAVAEKSLAPKNNVPVASESSSVQTTSSTKIRTDQAQSFSLGSDSLKKTDEEKKVIEVTDSLSSTDKQNEKKDKQSVSTDKLAIKLAIAPDYTTVKSATPNSLGISYGVLLEYRFSEHWSVATGGIWSKKIYSAYEVEYNGYKADWVDGDCRMWDIPINVYYNFSSTKPFSFYASVGLSSYLMNEENYVFYYDTPRGVYDYPKQVKGENNEWFKTLNVSIGMQLRMNQRFSLQFEPTLKAPLAGVGEGEVSLVSLGAFFNLRYSIPFNKSRHND